MMDQKNKALLLEYIQEIQSKKHRMNQKDLPGFDPGVMEYKNHWEAKVDFETNQVELCVEVQGTRYEQRSMILESVAYDTKVSIKRDFTNAYNDSNFLVFSDNQESLGSLPAKLCNALAPLYDEGIAEVIDTKISYLEALSKRSRNAKKSVLFIKLQLQLNDI